MNNTEKKLFKAITSHDDKVLGALFTTYNFDPYYFENDFLPALLNIDTNEEMEDHLKTLDLLQNLEERPISILMDARANLNCERKYPNYDIFPIYDSTQHSKLFFLVFEKSIMLFVSSANLTKNGIHENKEAYVEFKFQNNEDDWGILRDAIYFIEKMVNSNKIKNLKSFDLIKAKYSELKPLEINATHLKFIPVNPVDKTKIDFSLELKSLWQINMTDGRKVLKIEEFYIQSPFYEMTNNSDNNLLIDIEESIKSNFKQTEPIFNIYLPTNKGVNVTRFPIKAYSEYANVHLFENPTQRGENEQRFPHLKTYYVTDWKNYSLFMIGSSNFSPSGFGTGKSNWEANIMYFKSEYSKQDINSIIPNTLEITDIEHQVTEEGLEFDNDQYPDPVIINAHYSLNKLNVTLLHNLKSTQIIRLGNHVLNKEFTDLTLEKVIPELNEINLIVEENEVIIQMFPIAILDGDINDALKRIPSEIVAKFIEARYLRGDHLKLSEFIMEQRALQSNTKNEHITFDTTNMLMYEIRDFNLVTSNIYKKIKSVNNFPTQISYHLNSRFGLIECIKNYSTHLSTPLLLINNTFKILEVLTQVVLAFEFCENEESISEMDQFFNNSMAILNSNTFSNHAGSQINIYKEEILNLKSALTLKDIA